MLYCLSASSQLLDKIFKRNPDSVYVMPYKNKITAKPFVSQQFMSLNFIDFDNESKNVIYNPNVKLYTGVELNYKFLGFAFSAKIPRIKSMQAKFGDTKFFNFKLNITTSHFGAEAFFQRYNGFYLFNAKDFISNFSVLSDTFPQQEDLGVYNFGLSAYWQFSKKMSLAAAFNQTQRQLKTAGSFFFMTSYLLSGISNEGILVPDSFLNTLPHLASYRSGVYNTFAIAPGYGKTFVFEKSIYFTLVGYAGVGLQPQYNKFDNKSEFKFRGAYKFNGRAAIGYNGEIFFASFTAGADLTTIKLRDIKINVIPMFWKIGAGMRF